MNAQPHILVLGAGESGTGAALLAKRRGMGVFVSDNRPVKPEYRALLQQEGIDFEEGGHSAGLFDRVTEVVKSPGIPDTAPIVLQAAGAGIPVISEIEFAARFTDAQTVCITGSNGKTTTTSLIWHIMQGAGMDAGLAGNVGNSFARMVSERHHSHYALELSSFQLDGMYSFRAGIAVLLNITPDHLDRYDYNTEKYAASKLRIIQNQTPSDSFIWCADDEVSARLTEQMELKQQVYR
ncbi:MAG TPA: Mur ligase family protein, partial [Lentimicrobium sp.]|nr:Mur ligase family protein [Lentimicrobium sp.]